MEDRIKTAKRMLRFWERRLEELTSAFSVVNGVNVNAKRKEAGKENLPPTPPIREKGEEKKNPPEARAREEFETRFEDYFAEWWKLYPKKEGKTRCREKLHEILEAAFKHGGNQAVGELMDVISRSIHEWLTCDRWCRDGKRFVCNPLTWLEQERYLDTDILQYQPSVGCRYERKTANQNCIVDYSDRPI